jgi:DNA-binding beta-propeller fold protein YncE
MKTPLSLSLLAAAMAAVLGLAACQTPAPVAPAAPEVHAIGGFSLPESVTMAGPRVFVSNLGAKLEPVAKDSDGFISELDAGGRVIALHALPRDGDAPLHAPKGMAVAGGRLYVADIDRVAGFDLASGRRVFDAVVDGSTPPMLNDLAVESDGTLLVSDTLRGTLQRLDLRSGRYTLLAANIPGANGVAVDAQRQRAYVVGLGAQFEGGDLFEVDLRAAAPARRIEGGPHGILDGVALLPDGRLVVSDWVQLGAPAPGVVEVVERSGHVERALTPPAPLHGPADFFLDSAGQRLWVPSMLDNQVQVIALPR